MELIDLSDFFTTKTEAADFSARITAIYEMLFKTNFNLDNALTDQFGINKKDRFIMILHESNINPESLPAVKDFLFLLITKVNALPVLALTVAFEPHTQTLKTISEWFFLNMKKQVLFEITVDRHLVAGAAITYNGKFFDFSIRPVFERIVKNYLDILETAASKTHLAAKQNNTVIQYQTTPQTIPQPQAIAPQPTIPQQNFTPQPQQINNNVVNTNNDIKVSQTLQFGNK
jgi:F0F1-type ATP synthase delta subunit